MGFMKQDRLVNQPAAILSVFNDSDPATFSGRTIHESSDSADSLLPEPAILAEGF